MADPGWHPHLWHPLRRTGDGPAPLAVRRGCGVWLELEDGRQLIDAISSWWVTLHGHGEPTIAAAIATQARRRQRPWCKTKAAAEQSWMTPRPMITGMKIRRDFIPVSAETHESVSSAPKRISPGTCMNQ